MMTPRALPLCVLLLVGGLAGCLDPSHLSPAGYTCSQDSDCGGDPTFLCVLAVCEQGPLRYSDVVARTPGLVSYWRFGDAGTLGAKDELGVNPGALAGVPELGQKGPLAEGDFALLSAAQSQGQIDVPASSSLHPPAFSLEQWVSLAEVDGVNNNAWADMEDPVAGPYRELFLGFNAGSGGLLELDFSTRTGGYFLVKGTTPFPAHGWHHVVAVSSPGGKAMIYLDGNVYASTNQPADAEPYASSGPLDLGALSLRTNIALAEVAFYDRALSAEDVATHLQAAGAPLEDGL